jgi:hypothetical protein
MNPLDIGNLVILQPQMDIGLLLLTRTQPDDCGAQQQSTGCSDNKQGPDSTNQQQKQTLPT